MAIFMNIKRIIVAAVAVFTAVGTTACSSGGKHENTQVAALADVSVREATIFADPEAAVNAIYETLEDRKLEVLSVRDLCDYLDIEASSLLSSYAVYSDFKSGLCDVIVIEPREGERDKLREALYGYKERRIEEFRNYDVLNSYSIAQDAIVYDQGDYLVLLMLPDNEAAQQIVDEYIPQ